MSKILEKAFDATKKIVRSVFLGSPNLITSSDLNRQIEALKYQVDLLDDKTGMIITDANLIHNLSGGTLTVDFKCSQIKFKGCQFVPRMSQMTINMTSSAHKVYLCLTATKENVTYENDSTHEIAGAKFEDGTSYPAANQIVYKDETLLLTHALSTVENLVGVVATFTLSDTGNIIIRENFITNEQEYSLSMGKEKTITDFNPNLVGAIGNGNTYDEAFSKLQNQLYRGVRLYKLETNSATSEEHILETSAVRIRDVSSPGDAIQVFVPFMINGVTQMINMIVSHTSDEITAQNSGTLYYGYECVLTNIEIDNTKVYPLNVIIGIDIANSNKLWVSIDSGEGYVLRPIGKAYFIVYRSNVGLGDLEQS